MKGLWLLSLVNLIRTKKELEYVGKVQIMSYMKVMSKMEELIDSED